MKSATPIVTLAAAAVVLVLLSASTCPAADATLKLLVKPGEAAGTAAPVSTPIALPKELADAPAGEIRVEMRAAGSQDAVPGQIVKCDKGQPTLWWVLPADATAAEQQWTATLSRGKPEAKPAFHWENAEGDHLDLLYGDRRVTRYMYARDTSSDERAWETYKVLHHVFDAAGEDVITQGPGRKNKFPHHRGLFLGFSRLKVEGGGASGDYWHMGGVVQKHEEFPAMKAGPVLARSTSLVHWARNDEIALTEERETTAYRQPEPTVVLLDFVSRLKAPGKPVTLGGDPEHAGMQFRAHGDIDSGKTRYVFPEGVKSVQAERDLAWAAMNMVLKRDGGEQYTVQHINHPDNPEGTRYSAYRDYGRFGAFPTAELGPDDTLVLRYRIWVAPGDFPPVEELQKRWAAFAKPPAVEVK